MSSSFPPRLYGKVPAVTLLYRVVLTTDVQTSTVLYMTEQQRTDARRVPSSEFRTTFQRLDEPVVVTVLDRPIGYWYPAGVQTAAGRVAGFGVIEPPTPVERFWEREGDVTTRITPREDFADLAQHAPTSRSAPEIPSGSLVVGTAETDRAQIGTPDAAEVGQPTGTPRLAESPDGARVEAHGTSGADVRRPSAGPESHEPEGELKHSPSSGSSAPAIVADFERYMGEPVIHDPHFNAKGSRPAPKTRGKS